MPLRFRRSIKIAKGVRLNLSKSGISTSVGRKGATVNFSKRGTKTTVGLPGTGLSYSSQIGRPGSQQKNTQQNNSVSGNSSGSGGGCIGVFGTLVAFPFRVAGDVIKSFLNPDTRHSTTLLIGVLIGICVICVGASSIYGSTNASTLPTATSTAVPTNTIPPKPTDTLPPATITPQSTATFAPVALADFPRVAASRFQTMQAAMAELVGLYNQFLVDQTLAQNNDWYFHMESTANNVKSGAEELAAMNNYPLEYSDFHQQTQFLANNAELFDMHYSAAVSNQDTNALNQATVDLGNMVTAMNQASADLVSLNATDTPIPTIAIPTATYVYIPPAQPTSAHPPGTSGQCKDGTYTYAQHKQGACSYHHGVLYWWGP